MPGASLARRRSAQRSEPCPLSASQLASQFSLLRAADDPRASLGPRLGRSARVAGTPRCAAPAAVDFWSARAKREEKKGRKRARSSQGACRHGRRGVRALPSGFPRKLPAAATPSVTSVRTGMLEPFTFIYIYTRRSHDRIHANILTRTQTHSHSDSLAL